MYMEIYNFLLLTCRRGGAVFSSQNNLDFLNGRKRKKEKKGHDNSSTAQRLINKDCLTHLCLIISLIKILTSVSYLEIEKINKNK